MNNILIWPRSNLIFFGIAKSIKEKTNWNLNVFVDDNHISKSFYENQKMVDFEKVFFYNDYIFNKFEEIDLKYLEDCEKKYSLSIWKYVYSDRNFFEYNQFHKFNENEILSIIQYDLKLFERIIDEVKPNQVIMEPTGFHQDQIFEQICKSKGIKVFTIFHTRIGQKMAISQNLETIEATESIKIKNRTLREMQNLLKSYSSQQQEFRKKFQISLKNLILGGINFLTKIDNKQYRKYYPHYGMTKIRMLKYQFINLIKTKIRQSFINKNSTRDLQNLEKFVYFPLHFQPERSTNITAPYFVNQIQVIEYITKCVPIDYKIVVKEHPMMKSMGLRNLSFYKELLSFPNLIMIHNSIKNEELIKRCSMVITISGTGGLEAALYEKPVITFADTIYSEISSVYKVHRLDDLPNLIKKALGKKVNVSDLNSFFEKIERGSFDIDWHGMYTEILHTFQFGGITSNSNITEQGFKTYYEKRKTLFDLMADEFIKKLSFYKDSIDSNQQL